ncbi:max-like protein X isoform X1 [Octopus sinensis]|uniref:Max-like protein X n=1 Tax=Octopus sinensis TaxID=2607531 RepID=A0A6P7STY4_9MOLL|nr:max-like protein X isoform X1 [Octopus sinensis]
MPSSFCISRLRVFTKTDELLEPCYNISPLSKFHMDESRIQRHLSDSSFCDTSFDQSSIMDGDLKIEASPNGSQRFPFSHNNSSGSIAPGCVSSASSAYNTDDEDSDSRTTMMSYKDRRREAHTQAEQKRRDAIKKGYDDLQTIVPKCQQPDSLGSQKLSKASVLQKSIEYISFLVDQKSKQELALDTLRKEVMALKIMKANYEQILKSHQNTPLAGQNQVSDEVKFQVFKQIMDSLFQSFVSAVSVSNFTELSTCVISWLEAYCKPKILKGLVVGVLQQVSNQPNINQ